MGSFLIAAVLGPPDVTMSGCGNCLLLRLKVPTARGHQQLKDLYRELVLKVRRTRDGAQVKKSTRNSVNLLWIYCVASLCIGGSVQSPLMN